MFSLVTLLSLAAPAHAGSQWTCTVENPITTVLLDTDGYQTLHNLNVDGWEPKPLLDEWIETEDGCITANLAVHNLSGQTPTTPSLAVGDDYAVFTVLVDGMPMYGHISGCVDPKGNNVHCVVYSHEIDGATTVDGHAYSFVYPVAAGKHHVELYYAGYDVTGSIGRGAYVGGTILTLNYR